MCGGVTFPSSRIGSFKSGRTPPTAPRVSINVAIDAVSPAKGASIAASTPHSMARVGAAAPVTT